MVQINKYGIIKDGVCERTFRGRKDRVAGAGLCWKDLLEQNLVEENHGWLRIKKEPRGRKYGQYGGTYLEIGYLRFLQEVVVQLITGQKAFRLKWMEKWIKDISAFEFAGFSLTPHIHQDAIYQEWSGDQP